MEIDKKYFFISAGLGLLLYVVSFVGWAATVPNWIFLFLIGGLLTYLLAHDYTWSLPILIFESILGSQGRLLTWPIGNFNLSLRYLIFGLVFLFGLNYLWRHWPQIKNIKFKTRQNYFWLAGLIFIMWGLVRGLWLKTPLTDIYFDANAYGFWLLWPFFVCLYHDQSSSKTLIRTLTLALAAIFAQTVATYLLFVTQIVPEWQPLFYIWARDVRLAEMTKIGEYGVRIFWQSHIWAVMSLGLVSILLWLKKINYYYLAAIFLGFAMLSTILSLSRSFLLALAASLLVVVVVAWKNYFKKFHWPQLAKTLLGAFFICALLLAGTMYVARQHVITLEDLGQGRISELSGERATASRLEELQPLWSQISKAPLAGSGFGYKLTYQSLDPRQDNQPYTTYAFEWGYLDMWLKMGLGFLIALGGFLWATYKKIYQRYLNGHLPDFALIIFVFALTFLITTHLTTPYLNHPLGLVILFWLASFEPATSLKS